MLTLLQTAVVNIQLYWEFSLGSTHQWTNHLERPNHRDGFITVDTTKGTEDQNNRNSYNHDKILINNFFIFLTTL